MAEKNLCSVAANILFLYCHGSMNYILSDPWDQEFLHTNGGAMTEAAIIPFRF